MAHDAVIIDNPVGAQNVARLPRGFEGDPYIVHLQHGDVAGIRLAQVFQAPDMKRQQLRLHNLRDHPGQLFLYQLVRGDRLVRELFPCFRILERCVVASHRGANRPPADPVARLIQAAQRSAQAGHAR